MKKIFLIILVVILLVIGVLFLYTNYKNEANNIDNGCLILDFEDDEDIITSHIYNFSNNTYEKITKGDYEEILEYYPLTDGYCFIEREDIYGDEQRNIILKTEDNDFCIPINLTTGNISVKNNRVFYLSDFYTISDNYELCFIDIDTDKHNTLNKRISSYCLFNDSVYYISENCLFSNNLDLNCEKKIIENCKFICNSDNYLIFQTNDGIYKFEPIKNETISFCDIQNYNVITAINDDTIIISKQNKNYDEADYPLFNTKEHFYILYSGGKKKELSELRGKSISFIRYVSVQYK